MLGDGEPGPEDSEDGGFTARRAATSSRDEDAPAGRSAYTDYMHELRARTATKGPVSTTPWRAKARPQGNHKPEIDPECTFQPKLSVVSRAAGTQIARSTMLCVRVRVSAVVALGAVDGSACVYVCVCVGGGVWWWWWWWWWWW
jgi:hypothetical protein